MKKNNWISRKIRKLIKEGREQKQAVAIAESMWEDLEKKRKKKSRRKERE